MWEAKPSELLQGVSVKRRIEIWLWVKTNGYHVAVGAPPILEPILVVGLGPVHWGCGLAFDPWKYILVWQTRGCWPGGTSSLALRQVTGESAGHKETASLGVALKFPVHQPNKPEGAVGIS